MVWSTLWWNTTDGLVDIMVEHHWWFGRHYGGTPLMVWSTLWWNTTDGLVDIMVEHHWWFGRHYGGTPLMVWSTLWWNTTDGLVDIMVEHHWWFGRHYGGTPLMVWSTLWWNTTDGLVDMGTSPFNNNAVSLFTMSLSLFYKTRTAAIAITLVDGAKILVIYKRIKRHLQGNYKAIIRQL